MPTFLRSSNVYTSTLNSIHADARIRLRLTRTSSSHRHRAFVALALLLMFITGTGARAAVESNSFRMMAPAIMPSSSQSFKKRILMLRRNESQDGARFTLTSDAPLNDYKSFAEGERVCVMIPQAAFVSPRSDANGRGFADMRIEQRDDDVMLSFRLQPGTTVAVNQNFNRLDVVFITNERANTKGLK